MWRPPERLPAWSGLTPSRTQHFEPASETETSMVERALGPCALVERIVLDRNDGTAFRVHRDGLPPLLFRHYAAMSDEDLEAHELALWLFDQGVPTPEPTMAPSPLQPPDHGLFTITAFVEHRPLLPATDDIAL